MKIHYIHKTFLFHGKLRPMKQKTLRARAKQKHVASDRARRQNVPRHILYIFFERERNTEKYRFFS